MAILSTTNININGNKLPYYNSCNLEQEIGKHHTMHLHCLIETIETFCADNNIEIDDLLGAPITIETSSFAKMDFLGALKFKGLITAINFQKGLYNNEGDYIEFNIQSPTILSDDGSHYTSYSEMSFVEIIKKNFNDYDASKLSVNTKNATLNSPLLYTVQSNESCFEFAQRLAAKYGEWMFFNGEELVFGLPSSNKEIELKFGRDLNSFTTQLAPKPQNFNYFSSNYIENITHEKKSAKNGSTNNGYFNVVNRNSKDLFSKKTTIWANIQNDTTSKTQLDSAVEKQQKAIESNQIKIYASCDNPGIKLTSVVKILNNLYRVVKVTHDYKSNGEYNNTFEAVSINVEAYPYTNITAIAKSPSQMATVIDNVDPENLGRIKVQFPWQKENGLTTPWIRIVSPHAGKDKGFHFIPEKDEEVLIGFEGDNAEKPYVLGSLYHSQAKPDSWKTNSNNIKAIRTRSGHTIELNDTGGTESITITDINKNLINIDTANNNITITALENMTLNSKNMQINVQENLDLNVGNTKTEIIQKDKTEKITGNHNINSNNSTEQVANNKTLTAGSNYNQSSANAKMLATKGDLTLHANGVSTFQGSADVKISKG